MLPLLAAGDPFQHTWDTWVWDAYGLKIDLRMIPGFETLGITKAVLTLWFAAALLLFVGRYVGKRCAQARADGHVARGFAGVMEVMVSYVMNDLMKPYMPHHYKRPWFISIFCSFFFLILFCNLLGLLPPPFGFTATGVVWIPCGLAFGGTFVIMIAAGVLEHGPLGYAAHIAPPAPAAIRWTLLWFLEAVGLVIKPFALTIRLAANMTAGHIILAVLMSFLTASFTFAVSALVYPAAAVGFIAITVFEIVIAFIQAYIFTILSCVFVGAAVSHEH